MLKTVRLPIYDEDGMETRSYLEIDILFWLSSTAGLRSNLARVVEPEQIFYNDEQRHGEWDKASQTYADGTGSHFCKPMECKEGR